MIPPVRFALLTMILFQDAAPPRPPAAATLASGHRGGVASLAGAVDGGVVASAGLDGTLRIWDIADARCRKIIAAHDECYSVALSANGARVASVGLDGRVAVFDADDGALLFEHVTPGGWSVAVALSPEGDRVAAALADGRILVASLQKGATPIFLPGAIRGSALAWSPDGRTLASAAESITLWDVEAARPSRTLTGHRDAVRALAWSPDGKRIASASHDRTARVFDVESGGCLREFAPIGHVLQTPQGPGTNPIPVPLIAVAWSSDGSKVALAGAGRKVEWWNVETGRLEQTLLGHAQSITGLAVVEGRLVSASLDATVRFWP